MYSVHMFLDNQLRTASRMEHIPQVGDTVRLDPNAIFAKVTEVIWCMDESKQHGQRVNIRLEHEK